MTRLRGWRMGGAVVLLCTATAVAATAQTFSVLYDFGINDGDPVNPDYPAIISQGTDGYLYSTTPDGGLYGNGAVFKISPAGDLTVIYSFTGGSDGSNPYSGLTLGANGNLYGTTVAGGAGNCSLGSFGCGIVFEIAPSGRLTTLYNFTGGNDGAGPLTPPIEGVDGNFYGTTSDGANNANGTVYKISRTGVLQTLHEFTDEEGTDPSPLTQANDGNFYGMAYAPASDRTVLFRITPAGMFSMLHTFEALSCGALANAHDGSLYTACGGQNVPAVLLRVTPPGHITVLNKVATGIFPTDLVQATDGYLYGNANGGSIRHGTTYRINLSGTDIKVLHNFDGRDGDDPVSALTQHTNGGLFGDTIGGGTGTDCNDPNCGVFYGLDMGLGPFVRLSLPAGKVGQTGGILGQALTGTTTVTFNGVPANFTVVSDTFIRGTVPAGATTGYVTVVTPSGTLTSNVPFHVIK